MSDWRARIAAIEAVRRAIEPLDTRSTYRYPPPELPASEQDIAETETWLGHRLTPQYRSFLRTANGWADAARTLTIFGTRELRSGPLHDIAMSYLDAYDTDDLIAEVGVDDSELVVIGLALEVRELVVMGRSDTSIAGEVFVLDGEVQDDFADFASFLESLVDENERQRAYFFARSAR